MFIRMYSEKLIFGWDNSIRSVYIGIAESLWARYLQDGSEPFVNPSTTYSCVFCEQNMYEHFSNRSIL